MPRFVVLFHQCPPDYARPSHWDLMLEADGVLRTWALAQLPCHWLRAHQATVAACGSCPPLAASDTVHAEQLADHRMAYLDYEGPVSGNRGSVVRVASGSFAELGRAADQLAIALTSPSWCGRVAFHRDSDRGTRWQVAVEPPATGD